MALVEIKVPDIGNYKDVPVIEVLVKVGDTVKKDQGLITLESDKATIEVPSEVAGTVQSLKAKIGDGLSEGSVVAVIDTNATNAINVEPQAAAKPNHVAMIKTENLSPTPIHQSAEVKVEAAPSPSRESDQKFDAEISAPRSPPVVFDSSNVMPEKVPYASPSVRLFARELGVDLGKMGKGSGRNERLTKDDVQAYVNKIMSSGASVNGAAISGGGVLNLLPWPQVDFSKFGAIESKPLSRIKKISGANLSRNWVMIPHVTQFDEADITEAEKFRIESNKENEKSGNKLTMLAFLMKAVIAGLKKYPEFNASLDASGENLVMKKYFHLGFAADTPNGLVVPVLRNVDQKGLFELAKETAELAAKAREGKLGPAEMSGGCFSISSLGGIGGTAFTPIINAPEVAILGVSKSQTKPFWNGNSFEPRLILPLSLSYDHRVIDGASAARFTAFIAQQMADIRRLLL